jgi:TfoX/Sxy family transcriptional regulator of competence genes
MAYDEVLADRIHTLLSGYDGLGEKKMFGGVGYLLHGNMACGVHKDYLIVRVGPDRYKDALADSHANVFDLTRRPMKGWITIVSKGVETDSDLDKWVQRGVELAQTIPPK